MASDSAAAPIARVVLIMLAALALYVLSIGPVWPLTYWAHSPNWVFSAYSPIWWTAEHCEAVGKALDWYLRLWLPPDTLLPY
jgi:hypothetical protein